MTNASNFRFWPTSPSPVVLTPSKIDEYFVCNVPPLSVLSNNGELDIMRIFTDYSVTLAGHAQDIMSMDGLRFGHGNKAVAVIPGWCFDRLSDRKFDAFVKLINRRGFLSADRDIMCRLATMLSLKDLHNMGTDELIGYGFNFNFDCGYTSVCLSIRQNGTLRFLGTPESSSLKRGQWPTTRALVCCVDEQMCFSY